MSYVNKKACAPNMKENFEMLGTCYDENALESLALAYNQANPQNKIPIRGLGGGKAMAAKQIWKGLKNRLKQCDTEWCWLNQRFAKKIADPKIKFFTFKPKIPKGKDTWLSTIDIERVMQQFEQVKKNFVFLGAVPIDFETAPYYRSKFQNLTFKQMENDGITKIGIVFNEDPHDQSGSHWVAAFIDTKLREFQFFDSLGKKPNRRIVKWFERLNQHENPKYYLVWNDRTHQLQNNECGVYSLNFIIHRLLGFPFQKIVDNVIRDSRMNKQRKMIFLPKKYQ
jgi:hypothetical protein